MKKRKVFRPLLIGACLGILLLGPVSVFAGDNPEVVIKTELGFILVELYPVKAPLTTANFLKYVDEGLFEGASFYRVVTENNQPANDIKIEVIQGGLMRTKNIGIYPPIGHETTETTGIRHEDGVISMARNEPGTASSEFFICINDQPELDFGGKRNPDGQGFAAFGRVIEGMDIVRKIQAVDAPRQYLETPVLISGITRLEMKKKGKS
ncbi:MAG: peptidylprolyl isomerase [Candidatus Aminicenantes bacterium]|nr:peptidylprolyl isomerase [Candidatus Aminicenantes bacterium]